MLRPGRKADDFSSEIRAHIELEVEQLKAQGMAEEAARVAARVRFGNMTRAEEQFYESGRWQWADTLWRNIRFGLRMIARTPGSSVVAILVLALGIGATTAIFTLLNAVLLRSLPVQHPEQLVMFGDGIWSGSQGGLPDKNWRYFSYHGYRDFQRRTHVFSNVAAIDSNDFKTHGHVGSGANLEKVEVELVSGTYFDTLGVRPILGRTLTDADDGAAGAHPVAVASYSWWRRRFASNPSALGTTVTIGATVYSVIGVTPPEFSGVVAGRSPDLWIPLAMEKEISPGWNGLDKDLFQSLYIIARKKAWSQHPTGKRGYKCLVSPNRTWLRRPSAFSQPVGKRRTRQHPTDGRCHRDLVSSIRILYSAADSDGRGCDGASHCLYQCRESDAGARNGTRARDCDPDVGGGCAIPVGAAASH